LLVKLLERYGLTVTATNNGEEAIAEWEAHEPGYFSVALFDHRKYFELLGTERKCSPNQTCLFAMEWKPQND